MKYIEYVELIKVYFRIKVDKEKIRHIWRAIWPGEGGSKLLFFSKFNAYEIFWL